MKISSAKLASIALRIFTLGARFLFIFFLARYINPSLVGYYGIFTATVSYALYFVGLDFYTYTSREIIKTTANRRGQLLKGQATLSGLLYLTLILPGTWLLSQSDWPRNLIWWFFPILMLEHFNQEISRLLITLSEQLTANLILFIRQGSWTIAIIAIMIFDEDSRNLNVVMALWATAGIAAASFGAWKLKQLNTTGWGLPIDWVWVKKGITVSTNFLVATLALRGIQTIDRYFLKDFVGIEMVGTYVLLLGVASTLLVFLEAAVFSFAYPALIQHNHKGEHEEAKKKVKQIFFQTLSFSLLFSLISWLLLPYLINWIGNPIYLQGISWYPWLISAMTLNALALVPHFALYARGVDKPIIYSHLAAPLTFILLTWTFSATYSALAVLIGLNMAFFLIFLWKTYAYMTLIRKEKNLSPTHLKINLHRDYL